MRDGELQRFAGSCLCGEIGFEMQAEVRAFFHCHCRRCRKASGTGHASNVIVNYTSLRWTKGEALLKRFTVPDAERFFTHFCSNCGCPMPRVAAERKVAVIPAGALDDSPPLEVTARIFQDSRAPWSCQGDTLPHFDRYPGA